MSKAKGSVNESNPSDDKQKQSSDKRLKGLLLLAVVAVVVSLIARNLALFGNLLLVILGFGAVVIVHEFGHFLVAKLSGIKVEAFSIFMPPTVLGVQRIDKGFRFRVFPGLVGDKAADSNDGLFSFTVGKAGKGGETEYRIGLIPFGGFVKMLGQEDVGSVKSTDDPRSYANKPVGVRVAVIASGVIFNALSAGLVFVIVFLVGINLKPPVVGGVVPDSPAAQAGIRPGDEIIEVAGKSRNIDFLDVAASAALAGSDEKVKLKVKRGSKVLDFTIVPELLAGETLKGFGIAPALSLTIAEVSDPNKLEEKTGLLPGDRITAVDGREVSAYWELEEIVRNTSVPELTVLARRTDTVSNEPKLIETTVRLNLYLSDAEAESESELSHICSMVPRLQMVAVSSELAPIKDRFLHFLGRVGIAKTTGGARLQSGDVILSIGDVKNPTYKEFREVTTQYEGKKLPIKVLRKGSAGAEEALTVTVEPKRSKDGQRVLIGISHIPAFDVDHPVVAKTISGVNGPKALPIPRGALITAVEGVAVSNFCDVAREISRHVGRPVTIDFRSDEEGPGRVVLPASGPEQPVSIRCSLSGIAPFKLLERLYKADGPIDAIVMGYDRTVRFIAQAYLTLKRFLGGLVSAKNFMGPVGIAAFSYHIVTEKSLIYYAYFLALISAFIAVLNLAPILPFDGGHILFLLVEKIKGSAVSERFQGALAYAGWILVGALFVYVTFNDIVRSFLS